MCVFETLRPAQQGALKNLMVYSTYILNLNEFIMKEM